MGLFHKSSAKEKASAAAPSTEAIAPVKDSAESIESTENNPAVVNINGQDIDLSEIIQSYSEKPISAIKWLRKKTNLGLDEATKILDETYSKVCNFTGSKQEEDIALRQRISQMDAQGIPYCPKCFSTSLSADKKGFGVGKAVAGAAVAGPIGLAAGNIGSHKVRVTCLKCGYQFWAGNK